MRTDLKQNNNNPHLCTSDAPPLPLLTPLLPLLVAVFVA